MVRTIFTSCLKPQCQTRRLFDGCFKYHFKTGDAPIAAAPADLPKVDLNDYVGKYKMTNLPFPYVEISVKDGQLMMKAGEQGGPISPTAEPDKYDADGKATIYFIRDDTKKSSSSISKQ